VVVSGDSLSDVQVLVVDDQVDSANVILKFKTHGVRAEQVYDGVAAMERIQRACPELILLDVAAPRVKGLDLARALQHASLLQQPFLVAMSRYAADKRECAEAGFDLHLYKPIDVSTALRLLALLEETRGLRKQARPSGHRHRLCHWIFLVCSLRWWATSSTSPLLREQQTLESASWQKHTERTSC
jgi:CheY-like chemotaxis protein